MAALGDLEKKLADIFKGAPPLPANAKKSIAEYLPWINLVLGILALLAAWGLYHAAHYVNRLADAVNSYAAIYGVQTTAPHISATVWLALAVLVVQAVVYLMAFSPLKMRSKRGWNLLFYAALLGIVYGIVAVFTDYGGAGRLVTGVLSGIIELYFLFQIRELYTGGVAARTSAPAAKS